MANRLKAINAYRPQLTLGQTVQAPELARYLADRTGLNRAKSQ